MTYPAKVDSMESGIQYLLSRRHAGLAKADFAVVWISLKPLKGADYVKGNVIEG